MLKFGQNSKGISHNGFSFSTTMTKMTVFNAPVYVHGKQLAVGSRVVTVGVAKAKDFDFDFLMRIATRPATREITEA